MRVADLVAGGRLTERPERPTQPLISVLMPVYRRNASGILDTAIRSVLTQTCADLELILVDDGSRDGTYDTCLRHLRGDPRVSVVRHERNSGLPAVREYEAYRESRGRHIAFMFEDDEWTPDALEHLLAPLEGRRTPAVAHGWVHAGPRAAPGGVIGRSPGPASDLRSHNFVANHAVLVPRTLLDDVGLFDPHIVMRRCCDWDLLMRLERAADFIHVDHLVGYTGGPALADSIGRTELLDVGLVFDWMSRDRRTALRPGAFDRYEVDANHVNGTRLAAHERHRLQVSIAHHRQTHREYWPDPDEEAAVSTDATSAAPDVPRVLVVSPSSMTASTDLCFWNTLHGREDVVLSTVLERSWPTALVIDYDAVIISRLVTPAMERWQAAARTAGVPYYFFIDDDLFEMAAHDSGAARSMADLSYVRRALGGCAGVFASSPYLIERLQQALPGLPTYYLLPPGYDAGSVPEIWNGVRDEVWDIAYFGGDHRTAEFGLIRETIDVLRSRHRIRFTGYGVQRRDLPVMEGVDVVWQPYDVNYNAALRRAARGRHAVVIAPLFPRTGTAAKTLCKLGDATTLGAVAVLSDVEPYGVLRNRDACELCGNTVEEWAAGLERLFGDPARTARLYGNARQIVTTELNARAIGDDLVTFFAQPGRSRPIEARLAGARALALELAASRPAWGMDAAAIDPDAPVCFVPLHTTPRRYWVHASQRAWLGMSVVVSTDAARPVTGRLGYTLRDARGVSHRAGEAPFTTQTGGVWIDLSWPELDVTTTTAFILEVCVLDAERCGVLESPASARHSRWSYRWLGWSRPAQTLVRRMRYRT